MPAEDRTQRTWVVVLLIVAAFYGLLIGLKLARTGSPASFIVAGERFSEPGVAPIPADQILPGVGYDGQFYFRIAIAPWSAAEVEQGMAFDVASYRQQRILYPLLAYMTSFGNAALTAWMLIAVNFVAVLGVAWMAARIMNDLNRSVYWGVFVAIYPGFMFALVRDLTDIVAMFWLLAAIRAHLHGRLGRFSVYMSLAILSRESTVVHRRESAFRNLVSCGIPVLVYASWSSFCTHRWPDSTMTLAPRIIGIPFHHMLTFFFDRAWRFGAGYGVLWITQALLLLAWLARAGVGLFRSEAPRIVTAGFVTYVLVVVCMNVWREDVGFLRIFAPAFVLAAFIPAKPGVESSVFRWMTACWAAWAAARCFVLAPIYMY